MTDSAIRLTIKEIYIDDKHVGYIGISRYYRGDRKAIGFGNFMIFYKNHGYGTYVMKKLIEKFKKTADLIYCYVDDKNKGAIRFYDRLGKVNPKVNSKNEYLVVFYDNGKYKHG